MSKPHLGTTPDEKDAARLERRRATSRLYYAKNKAARNAANKAHYAANREAHIAKATEWQRKNTPRRQANQWRLNLSRYGLTPEQWDGMWDAQGGLCATCPTPLRRGRGGAATDHCHASGRVRQLLCAPCNTVLGLVKESPATLQSMIAYLERHSCQA